MSDTRGLDESLGAAGAAIRGASALLVCAGAGMGVDSGLPDFRGDAGFWKAYPAFAHLRLRFVDLASPQWFRDDPELAWGFYGHRLGLYRETRPHQGFAHLLAWSKQCREGGFVFTSNVDGQFQQAGFGASRVVECHGSIHHLQCTQPCSDTIWDAGRVSIELDEKTMRAQGPLPRCPRCGSIARPNILMFGDGAWLHERTSDQEERLADWLDGIRGPLVVIECGAGSHVPTVRRFSEGMLVRGAAALVRINPREPEVPTRPGAIGLGLPAAKALDHIAASRAPYSPSKGAK